MRIMSTIIFSSFFSLALFPTIVHCQINRVYIGGTHASDGYTSGRDTLTIIVNSSSPRIALSSAPNIPYDCTPIPNSTYYECNILTPERVYSSPGLKYIVLLQWTTYGIPQPIFDPTYPFPYKVDIGSPVVELIFKQNVSSSGNFLLDITVNDTLGDANPDCSGVKSLNIYNNGIVIGNINLNSLTKLTNCQYQGTNIPLNLSGGTNDIYAVAEDNVGNSGQSSTFRVNLSQGSCNSNPRPPIGSNP